MDAQVVIVGSGPSGVSAAWPLVEAGIRVLMLDAAHDHDQRPALPTANIGQFRQSPTRWRAQLGNDLGGLRVKGNYSPKLVTPLARHMTSRFASESNLTTNNFLGIGCFGKGGLSSIWGANVAVYNDDDLAGYPISQADLLPSYKTIINRIGVCGAADETLGIVAGQELLGPAARVYLSYLAKPSRADFQLEKATNAVLMSDKEGRQGCANCGLCLWGCVRNSIYSSEFDLVRLRKRPNFFYQPDSTVHHVESSLDGPVIKIDGRSDVVAPHVMLAAGTIMTAAVVLRHLNNKTPVRLLTNPVGAVAFVVPRFIGSPLQPESFALAQLNYQLRFAGTVAAGSLFCADTLPLSEVANRLPLRRATALGISHALAPALLLGTCYLPSQYSANQLSVNDRHIHVSGSLSLEARSVLRQGLKRLSTRMRRLGAFALPGSLTLSPPGADVHYGGTLARHAGLDGTIAACPGLYAVDGSILPCLPARGCTLTIMANADRVARLLLDRLRTG